MAFSRSLIPLEEVLVAWSRARDFEKEGAGIYFPLVDNFWFLPKHSTGFDARYPTLPIAKYAKENYGVIIGKEEEFMVPEVAAEEDDNVFNAPEVNLVNERTVLENLLELEDRMKILADVQLRRTQELIGAAERRTAIRIANSRGATAQEVAAAENTILEEIKFGRGTTVFEVETRLDSGSPMFVAGAEFLRRNLSATSDYGSSATRSFSSSSNSDSNNSGSNNANNNGSGNNDKSSDGNNNAGASDDLVKAYREATKEVVKLEADVKNSLEVASSRKRKMKTKTKIL